MMKQVSAIVRNGDLGFALGQRRAGGRTASGCSRACVLAPYGLRLGRAGSLGMEEV